MTAQTVDNILVVLHLLISNILTYLPFPKFPFSGALLRKVLKDQKILNDTNKLDRNVLNSQCLHLTISSILAAIYETTTRGS